MGRRKKNGNRAEGIESKSGHLYIVTSNYITKDGVKSRKKIWHKTGLADTPENIKKASELRFNLMHKRPLISVDRNISLTDYIDLAIERKKRQVNDTTYVAYCHRAKKIKEYFPDVKCRNLDESMVERFLDDLFITYQIQPRSVKDIKILFSSIIDQAVKDGVIVYNPVKAVVINKNLSNEYAKEKKDDEEFFSYQEAQLFLDRIKEHELYELFYTTLFFGLRRQEVLGLRWSAIDFKEKKMYINHTVTKADKVRRTNTTKTSSSARSYPLTDEQLEMFSRLRDKEEEYRRDCKTGYFESDYIFKKKDGTLYYPDTVTKIFNKLISQIPELPQDITFHGLRSSCVSILVHQNMDVKSIQKWVGHADINTTLKIYAKVKEKEAKQGVSMAMKGVIPLKDYTD